MDEVVLDLNKTSGHVGALYQDRHLLPQPGGNAGQPVRIPDFDEKKGTWEDWRDKFLMAVFYNHWNDTQAKVQLATRLTGPIVQAQSALIKRTDASLQDVITKIDAWFCPPGEHLAKENRFLTLYRNPGELLVRYGLRIETAANKAFPGGTDDQVVNQLKVQVLLRGCSEAARTEIFKGGQACFTEAMEIARRQEHAEIYSGSYPAWGTPAATGVRQTQEDTSEPDEIAWTNDYVQPQGPKPWGYNRDNYYGRPWEPRRDDNDRRGYWYDQPREGRNPDYPYRRRFEPDRQGDNNYRREYERGPPGPGRRQDDKYERGQPSYERQYDRDARNDRNDRNDRTDRNDRNDRNDRSARNDGNNRNDNRGYSRDTPPRGRPGDRSPRGYEQEDPDAGRPREASRQPERNPARGHDNGRNGNDDGRNRRFQDGDDTFSNRPRDRGNGPYQKPRPTVSDPPTRKADDKDKPSSTGGPKPAENARPTRPDGDAARPRDNERRRDRSVGRPFQAHEVQDYDDGLDECYGDYDPEPTLN